MPSLSLGYSEATYLGCLSTDFLQKSCELVACYTELENKKIQLNLDLKLAQENLQKARDEAKGTAGELLSTVLSFWPSSMLISLAVSQTKWRRL